LLLLFFSGATHASGCLGGDWTIVERKALPDEELCKSCQFPEPEMKVKVSDQWAHVTYSIGYQSNRLLFTSQGPLDIGNLVDVLKALNAMPDHFTVQRKQTVEFNPSYDDCFDIPENTRRTTTQFSFTLRLPNGATQSFDASDETYDPPVNR
jgi:hypothetical protein